MTGVSDLVGEPHEIKSATSTSTAADLLKQGAGWRFTCLDSDLQTLLSSAHLQHVYTNSCFLLTHKQACNVLYLNSVETESLTGPEAVSKATKYTLSLNPRPAATVVHFKVSAQGITLTDNKRRYNFGGIVFLVPSLWLLSSKVFKCANAIRLFFRRHYPISSVTFSSLDPQDQRWVRAASNLNSASGFLANDSIFGQSGGASVHCSEIKYLRYFACSHAFIVCRD